MKLKTIFTLFLVLAASVGFAQQKLKVVRKSDAEKPKVERVDAKGTDVERIEEPTKAQVDRIEDKPKTQVDRIEDPAKPKVDRIEDPAKPKVDRIEDTPKTKVDRIEDVDRIQEGSKPTVDRIEDGPKPKVDRIPDEKVKTTVPIIEDPKPTQVDRIEDGPKANVERIVDGPKPNVDRIEDGPKPKVDRIEDDPKPKVERIVDPKKATVDRIEDGPKPKVDRIEDPKGATVDILEDEEGGSGSGSDGGSASGGGGPASPNAGRGVNQNQDLGSRFQFNRKIGFYVTSPEGDLVSYFYLDTHTGASLMDHEGNQEMAGGKLEGEIDQIMTAMGDILSFTKSSEGNFSFKMGSGSSPVMKSLLDEKFSEEFSKNFKPTGQSLAKGQGGSKFNSKEYSGSYEGQTMSIYLANPGQVRLDTRYTRALSGYFGLGYIVDANGTTHMVTGIQGDGVSIFMTYNEPTSKTFDGSAYQSMGDLMGAQVDAANEKFAEEAAIRREEIDEIEDSKLKLIRNKQADEIENMQKEGMKGMEEMAETSDPSLLGKVANPDFFTSFYETGILEKEAEMRDLEIRIESAKKDGDTYNLELYQCRMTCLSRDKLQLTDLKRKHLEILKRYPEGDENRELKVNTLMVEYTQSVKPCDCN